LTYVLPLQCSTTILGTFWLPYIVSFTLGLEKFCHIIELFTSFPLSHYGKLSSSECHLYVTQVYCSYVRSICYLSEKINVWYEQHFLYVWLSGRSNTVKINIKHIEYCIVIQVLMLSLSLSLSLSVCLSLSLSLSLSHTHTHTQNTGSINVGSVHRSHKISIWCFSARESIPPDTIVAVAPNCFTYYHIT
jgi:hypothetical protein